MWAGKQSHELSNSKYTDKHWIIKLIRYHSCKWTCLHLCLYRTYIYYCINIYTLYFHLFHDVFVERKMINKRNETPTGGIIPDQLTWQNGKLPTQWLYRVAGVWIILMIFVYYCMFIYTCSQIYYILSIEYYSISIYTEYPSMLSSFAFMH